MHILMGIATGNEAGVCLPIFGVNRCPCEIDALVIMRTAGLLGANRIVAVNDAEAKKKGTDHDLLPDST
jgi:hypothetical protein